MTESDVATSNVRRITELIELGRDREAAVLGISPIRTPGGTMDVLSQLDELAPLLAGVVSEITSDELDNATPCADFSVQGVLEHMIGGATTFAAAFRGSEPEVAETGDVLAAFGPALTDLSDALHESGALDRTVNAPFGAVPGATFARFVVLDGLVHGWDLATATGQPYAPSDLLVAEVAGFATDAIEPLRDGRTFAEPTQAPASASPIERLAAFTGRSL